MCDKQQIVTIDGPAGVGKSTVSRQVAVRTGFTYLDTGAMYRAVGWFFCQNGVELDDPRQVEEMLDGLELQLVPAADEMSDVGVLIGGRDVTEAIRTAEMAMIASRVSAIPEVRRVLTRLQRQYGEKGGIVAEGRDTGTVVFPRAAYKFFLDACPEERARRRVLQLQARGNPADFAQILAMIRERDHNDSRRAIAPLVKAEDALSIDTTGLTIAQVVETILATIDSKRGR